MELRRAVETLWPVDSLNGRSPNERFLRHRFSPKPTSVATPNSLPKRNHVAKEATANQKIKLRNIFRMSQGFELKCLMLGAMPLSPANLIAEIAAFRMAATFCGIAPALVWLASSPKVTSRTQCSRFSIPQWPRFSSSSCFADACWCVRLVTR